MRTSSAPSALSITRRSIDIDSGMVSTSLYPLAAATMASPMPVFPDVGSTSVVVAGSMSPARSADSIMRRPMRSFTLQQGSPLSFFKLGGNSWEALKPYWVDTVWNILLDAWRASVWNRINQ